MRAKIKGVEGEKAAPARNRRGAHRGRQIAVATELGGGGGYGGLGTNGARVWAQRSAGL